MSLVEDYDTSRVESNNPMAKILIVDDEPEICKGISEYLREAGYETLTAYRGEEGYNQIQDQKPDLVILDLALPDVDGTILYERIRNHAQLRSTKVIFLTAIAGGAPNQLKGIDRPEYSLLSKPISMENLRAEVARVLALS